MNVTCTGCPAKYAVPDEKVRGKKVRITCKHCGTNIVVDGTAAGVEDEGAKPAHASSSSGGPRAAAVAPVAPAELTFIVGFADGRQQQHTASQIAELYGNGQIDDEALVWRDGMPDWLPVFDVPELAAALAARGIARRASSPMMSRSADDEPTLVVRSPLEALELAEARAAAATRSAGPIPAATERRPTAEGRPAAEVSPAPAPLTSSAPLAESAAPAAAPFAAAALAEPLIEAPLVAAPPVTAAPVAARRADRRGGSVDLFGAVAHAGGEHDASLHIDAPSEHGRSAHPDDEPAHKLTGARNESSVLFSLDALTKGDPKAKQKQKAHDRESEQASVDLFGNDAPDSLMNLGGGLSALAAPDFTRPVSAVVEPINTGNPLEASGGTSKKGGGAILLVALVAIAAIAGLAFVMMNKQPVAAPAPPAPIAAGEPTVAAPATGAAATATEATANGAAPASSGSGAIPPDTAASAATPASAASAATSARASAAAPSPSPPVPPTAAAASKPSEPSSKKPESAAAADTAPPVLASAAPAPEGAAFDKSAAVAALSEAAGNAVSCKKPDGPTGSGKVSVTFAPSGRATATSVAGALAGTEVGGCVARLFRSAKVPPFSGDPVTVSKSFSIE